MRFVLLHAIYAAGCAPDLRGEAGKESDTAAGADTEVYEGTVTVDSTSYDEWVYFDLAGGMYADPPSPEDSKDWDLGFQRFNIKVNGGVSGTAGVEVAALQSEDYGTLFAAPTDGYVTDEADGDGDGVPDYAFKDWYVYDYQTHVLTPADIVYVARSAEGSYFKIQIEDYYDDAGSPAMVRFSWDPVENP